MPLPHLVRSLRRTFGRCAVTLPLIATCVALSTVHPVASDEPAVVESDAQPAVTASWPELFDGKQLGGWQVIERFDFQDHGPVRVENQTIIMGRGKPATGISWKGAPPPRSNYRISFQGRRTGGSDFFCGLTFPVKQEYCSLILGGWGGQVVGLSNINGLSAVENETTQAVDFAKDQWYAVELTVLDDRIEVKIDGRTMIDVDTEDRKFSIWWEQEPVTPLGIVTWNTVGEIKELRLSQP